MRRADSPEYMWGTVNVDGKPARFRDSLANDQDWAPVFYLRNAK